MAKIIGVDYGAKMSGNTVVAHMVDDIVHFSQCPKKKDADAWLVNEITSLAAEVVYLDAPLSLPGVYFGKGNNYHYREADIITKAMSPMFLGGLTARAMKLRSELNHQDFHEIYPAYFQAQVVGSEHYKKDISLFLADLVRKESFSLAHTPENWHQVDALMALLIGIRHQQNRHTTIGIPEEGIIII